MESKYNILTSVKVPDSFRHRWQDTLNILVEMAQVPAALIMKVHAREIEVFAKSSNPDNVYHEGEKAELDTGLYCETVMSTRQELIVPNALADPDWDHNPDIELGMISYLGLPLTWPNGEMFGTICVLDKKDNSYTLTFLNLLRRFRDAIQSELNLIFNQYQLREEISKRKQAQEAAAHSERQFRLMFERHNAVMLLIEPDSGKIVDANLAAERFYGHSRKILRSMFIQDINQLPPEEVAKECQRAKLEQRNHFIFPHRLADGRIRTVEVHSLPLEIEGERLLFSIIHDITEQKRIEDALRKSEAQKKAILDGITTSLSFVNEKLEILWANKAAAVLVNKSPEKMIGHKCHALWADPEKPCDECPVLKAFKTKKSEHSIMYTLDGRVWDKKAEPVFDDKENLIGVLEIAYDTTETKLLQDSLIRSERLAATGQLAASIAHEINSPLQGITAMVDVIRKTCIQDEDLLTNIDLIHGAARCAGDTVKKLLDLNRPGKERKQSININTIIEDTVALLQGHLKKNKVHVNLNLFSKAPHIKASPQQLGQVFMNLINNAVEAIRSKSNIGREISITTSLREGDIIIKVADTGPGIPDEALQHIFDPFYTRKKTMGMGVGLSICHGIITDHGGTIVAENSPEGGAVFTITLPVNP